MKVDAVIFGGGAAGLWLLDTLVRNGSRVILLEAGKLGGGQTIASQGIIHGGLKYMLDGLFTQAAREIRHMPVHWRECLAGQRQPRLEKTRIRTEHCYLWRTRGAQSRLAMLVARWLLKSRPTIVRDHERPALLANCSGSVARVDEQVISPASFVAELAERYISQILAIDPDQGLQFDVSAPGQVNTIRVADPKLVGREIELRPRIVILTAGEGNAQLRNRLGLTTELMQRRPLHMVLLRGPLPQFNGHCIDGTKTRVTITSDVDSAGRTIWQVGGQIAEHGVALDPLQLIHHTRSELHAVLPAADFSQAEWTTYRINRAEAKTRSGFRPHAAQVFQEGNVLTAWPTKLALVPQLVSEVIRRIGTIAPVPDDSAEDLSSLRDWPRPKVALPPWESATQWYR